MWFLFNDTSTTEIYTLSLHDALPISPPAYPRTASTSPMDPSWTRSGIDRPCSTRSSASRIDRKSTRLNYSHANISYAVFCLNKNYQKRQYARHPNVRTAHLSVTIVTS